MKILVLHNRYQQRGGEDTAMEQEVAMLSESGHDVVVFLENNDGISGLKSKVVAAIQTVYSADARERVSRILQEFRPDIMHVHNWFTRLSPSVYDAAFDSKVPVVQTLHNFRMVCPSAALFRDGHVCTDCLGREFPWPGVLHACYRDSRKGSFALASMIFAGRQRHIEQRVSRYITLTEFSRDFFLQNTRMEPEQVVVKPNVTGDRGKGSGQGKYALYIGRLTVEKGLRCLLDTWAQRDMVLPLRIVGIGPLADEVEAAVDPGRIDYLGQKSSAEVIEMMKEASVLIVPSLWYEGLPMVIPEAYSTGLPVVGSDFGSLSSLIHEGRTGFKFMVGSVDDLARTVNHGWRSGALIRMRDQARAEFERTYSRTRNLFQLENIYQAAVRDSENRRAGV